MTQWTEWPRWTEARRRRLGIACLGLLAGCAAGPDYTRPVAPLAARFAELPALTASAPVAGGAAQRFVTAQRIQADWWALFQSPALDALIKKAFATSPTLDAADAALRVAQEMVSAQQGLFLPTLQAGYAPTRTKLAANLGGNSPVAYNVHTAQLNVGYVPDVFGANRRQVESLQAQAAYQQLQVDAAYTTLASNIVAAAIQEALLRSQLGAARDAIAASREALALVRRQWQAGSASRLDVALQETALAQAQQLLPALNKQLAQTGDLLRALVGDTPDAALSESFELASFTLPLELPLSLPSALIEQRPDVRAAEEQLHAGCAQVGIAMANRLPQFTIDGSLGGAASHVGQMFLNSGLFFNLAANVTAPLFDGGALRHRQRGAEQALRQAEAQYRSTVIIAFQNVADSLHAIHADAEALAAAAALEKSAGITLDLIRRQLARGYVERLALINAEQSYRQASLNLAQAQAARLADTAALFQALGGGWRAGSRPADTASAVVASAGP